MGQYLRFSTMIKVMEDIWYSVEGLGRGLG